MLRGEWLRPAYPLIFAALLGGCSFGAPSESDIFGEPETFEPPEGIYTYDGDSLQEFTILGSKTTQHPSGVFVASVVHLASGCWRFRMNSGVDPAPLQWEEITFCAKNGGLVKSDAVSDVRVQSLGSETLTTIHCDPPDDYIRSQMATADSWGVFCTGSNKTTPATFDFGYPFNTAGPYSYQGVDDVQVAGRVVKAFHFHEVRQISGTNPSGPGSYSGTQDAEWWLSRDDGLPVERKQTVDLSTDTGIPSVGNVLYHEVSGWTLSALAPAPLGTGDAGL